MKRKSLIAMFILMTLVIGLQAQNLTQDFNHARIFTTLLVYTSSGLSALAIADQTTGGTYKADAWESVRIQAGDTVTQGTPGQSCYYSICKTLRDTHNRKDDYWKSLQVKCHPCYGCRGKVVRYRVTHTTDVALAKVVANRGFGAGGAWQFFIPQAAQANLTAIDTITLIP